jgi:hypothetical protein
MSIIDKLAKALDGLKSNDLIGRYVLNIEFKQSLKYNSFIFEGLEKKKNIVELLPI